MDLCQDFLHSLEKKVILISISKRGCLYVKTILRDRKKNIRGNSIMVKIDLITGFLGSGKTTFIKKYAKYLLDKGMSIGILENDFFAKGFTDILT